MSTPNAHSLTPGHTYTIVRNGVTQTILVQTPQDWGCTDATCDSVHYRNNDNGRGIIEPYDRIEVISDDTIDATPDTTLTVGTYVTGTRHLTDDGIVGARFRGVIVKNENGIIIVANDDYKYITGPDSITPTDPPNDLTGRRVRITSNSTGIDDAAVGQEGIIVGWYGDRPYVVLDNGPHYQFRNSGAWVVMNFEYVDNSTTHTVQVGDRVQAFEPNIPFRGSPWFGTVRDIQMGHPTAKYHVVLDMGSTIWFNRVEPIQEPASEPITFETKERMIGKRIRVVYASGHQRYVGVEGVVTEIFYMREHDPRWTNKVDGITVKIAETDGTWVQDYIVLDDEPVVAAPAEPETPALMEVGQRVRYVSGEFEGQYGTIIRVDATDNGLPYYVQIEGGGRGWTNRVEAADTPVPDTATAQLEAENRRLRDRIERMVADWAINDEAIKNEAERRGWCGDYERVVEGINRTMREFAYTPRVVEEDYELEIEITGQMRTTRTVTVTAGSREEAWEMFNEDPHSFIDPDDALTETARFDSFEDVEINPA